MHTILTRALLAAVLLAAALPARADIELERLIEQTGIQAGATALRDLPGWREPRRIVIWDSGMPIDEIRAAAPAVEFVVVNSATELGANAAGADAIIGWCTDRMAAARQARWVQALSAGVERCLAVNRIGTGEVVLTNMQKMSSPVIAEHMLAMMLALARALPQYAKRMPAGDWSRELDDDASMQSVAGKTLLVVGLGGIGTEIARRAAALDMRVVGTRRSSRQGPEFVAYVGLADELYELAADADFIVNALPLTPETTGLFDARFFAAARQGALFFNVGRGRSVVTDDLVAALASGRLAGAGLDVTDPEPLPADHPLWNFDNVLITPHVAASGGNRARQRILLLENLRRFVAGDALLNVVDPELGY